MYEEVLKNIKREKMIEEGDIVIAGVSGGADSVCLLLLLSEIQKQIPFTLQAVHVEHGIRGDESRRDENFVRQLCEKKQVPCQIFHENIPSYAEKTGIGLEEAARIRRYECYKAAAKQYEKNKKQTVRIALAHHAEDNAETVLFQMIRGSGISGLCGMRYCREGQGYVLIRPLLGQTRSSIEQYLKEHQQEFCIDVTNEDIDYSRNRIRHQVLPELTQVNSRAVEHINRSAAKLQMVEAYLDGQIQKAEHSYVMPGEWGSFLLKKELWEMEAKIIRQEVIHKVLGSVAGSRKDLSAVHIESVENLWYSQVGRQIELPYQMVARRDYNGVLILKGESETDEISGFYEEVLSEKRADLETGKILQYRVPGGTLCLRTFCFQGKIEEIQKKSYTKWLDYDKIKCGLQIRTRASGDYLTVDETGHRKKLKEYFINEKIPAKERGKVLLLTEGSHVLWVIGGRISADCRITEKTKRILEVQFLGGRNHES